MSEMTVTDPVPPSGLPCCKRPDHPARPALLRARPFCFASCLSFAPKNATAFLYWLRVPFHPSSSSFIAPTGMPNHSVPRRTPATGPQFHYLHQRAHPDGTPSCHATHSPSTLGHVQVLSRGLGVLVQARTASGGVLDRLVGAKQGQRMLPRPHNQTPRRKSKANQQCKRRGRRKEPSRSLV
jgi:hypothetical protein